MADRRRLGTSLQPARHFAPSGLSRDGMHVLRAIRPQLDGETYRGTDAAAAMLAGLSVHDTATALRDLATRGYIRLDRASPDRTRV